jgi:hypothetical protein
MDQSGKPFEEENSRTRITIRNIRDAIRLLDELRSTDLFETKLDLPNQRIILKSILPARIILQLLIDFLEDVDILDILTYTEIE